jgi:CubicO group peptidase (beta-lactamase class C family)
MPSSLYRWLGAVALGACHCAQATGPAHVALDRELAAIVSDAQRPLSGLSVLAIRDAKVVYQQQFGLRRLATSAQALPAPVTPDTLFRIASISKMMTTLGLMRLVEEGQLALDEDIGRYLGFSVRNPAYPAQAITLRHLLSHTSSLRDAAGYSWGSDSSLQDVLLAGGKHHGQGAMWAQDGAPGQYFTYSNLNWGVIGTIMERVSGERFDRLMQRLLLQPLGLRGGYNPSAFSPQEVADTATLYRRRPRDSETWKPSGPWVAQVDDFGVQAPQAPAGLAQYVIGSNATLFSPTGGLRISAADLGKVMLMLLNDGRHQGRQFLQPATLHTMFSAHWRDNGHNGNSERGLYRSWGLGSQRFDPRPGGGNGLVEGATFSAVGHLGEAYGLMATFAVDLEHKQGLISLIGGFGNDPATDPGRYSALSRSEERILTALYRRAIQGQAD